MNSELTFSGQLTLCGEEAMSKCAARLANKLNGSECILLSGTLGAGKTTFARGLIRALCGENTEVVSPTFMLLQEYDAPAFRVMHYDLYRLERPDELQELGLDESLGQALVLVEWPQIADGYWPKDRVQITIKHDDANNAWRQLQLLAHGSMVALIEKFCQQENATDHD